MLWRVYSAGRVMVRLVIGAGIGAGIGAEGFKQTFEFNHTRPLSGLQTGRPPDYGAGATPLEQRGFSPVQPFVSHSLVINECLNFKWSFETLCNSM